MTDSQQDQRAFWDARAGSFPRFAEGEENYEAGMLRLVKEQGVDFYNKSVLDVGCGSGMYTIRIARQARQVTALDISKEMLRILREDASDLGLANIEYVCADWMDYANPHRHDIVFCSMTPAIHDDESRAKLLRHTGEWLVFIGFSKRLPSDVMQGLQERYDLAPGHFDSALRMREWLDSKTISYACKTVEGRWDVPWQRDALIRHCSLALERHGIVPDREFLDGYLEQFRDSQGMYREKTAYAAAIISCRKSW